jgi:hypothetical protein
MGNFANEPSLCAGDLPYTVAIRFIDANKFNEMGLQIFGAINPVYLSY